MAEQADRPKVVMASVVIRALIEAGVLPDGMRTRRVVIDLQAGPHPAVMYVEYYGDERLLAVAQTLDGVEISSVPAPAVTTMDGERIDLGPRA